MGKAPAFQFYPGDWIQDTRFLSLAAKGAWIDLLCAMWRSQTRGKLSLPMLGYSRLIGATVDQAAAVIKELTDMQVCDSVTEKSGDVTLTNRRMYRDQLEREKTRIRVEKHRVKRLCNANVTPPSSFSSSSSVPTNDKSLPLDSAEQPTGAREDSEATRLRPPENRGNDFTPSGVVDEIVEYLGDEKSRAFYLLCEKKLGGGRVWELFGEMKDRNRQGKLSGPARYLTAMLKKEIEASR